MNKLLKYIKPIRKKSEAKSQIQANNIKWTDKVSAYANSFIAIATIVGLFFIWQQLNETIEQTKSLNKTLMQSYRPLGYITQGVDSSGLHIITIKFLKANEKNKMSFQLDFNFSNKGSGILSLIGYISFISANKIDFREDFLNSKITNYSYDGFYPSSREANLLQGDISILKRQITDIVYQPMYYFYMIIFYKDQEGNLYDTYLVSQLPFEKNTFENVDFPYTLSKSRGIVSHYYNYYDNEDLKRLEVAIINDNHPIKDYLFK